MRTASVYVHFPWCIAKCPYCDFVSYAAADATGDRAPSLEETRRAIDHQGYADAVIRELEARARALDGDAIPRRFASVFFGGGTPSLWEPGALGRVLARIRSLLPCTADLEVTVECNPTSLDRDGARALLDAGVNRLSIGTQALRQEQLRFLGRLHDPDGARAAIAAALASGVPRVSTDLIFGLPTQTAEDASEQALALADLGLAHLSCYQLTIEPNTAFGELARRGRLPRADDGRVAEAFVAVDEALTARGLCHYEISNYARPGEEARHNLGYWHGDEYLGLGCAAFGFLRDRSGTRGTRYRNALDPRRYVAATRDPGLTVRAAGACDVDPSIRSAEPLDGETLLRERIMLGLRVVGGLDLAASARELGVPGWTPARTAEAARLEARGRLRRSGDRLAIPPPAWLFADDTAARLF